MARFSRRSFLGGLLGTLAAWLGGKAQAAPPPAVPAAPVPPLHSGYYSHDAPGIGTVTTYVYDACGTFLYSTGPTDVYTYPYPHCGGSARLPPAEPPQEPPDPDAGTPPTA